MELLLSAGVSLLVQFLKGYLKLGEYATLGCLLIIAFAAAGLYTTFVALGIWETFAGILILAGAFYAFIVQRFTKGSAIGEALGVR